MKGNAGFTLLELIITIVIVGVLAVSASSRFADNDAFTAKVERENVLSALSLAQQQAMSGKPTTFLILSATSFTIRNPVTTTDFQFASSSFPIALESGVTLNPATLTITYNSLGEITSPSTPLTITIESNGVSDGQVCVETSGFIHAQGVGDPCL